MKGVPRKITLEECESFNKLRMQNLNKRFLKKELLEMVAKLYPINGLVIARKLNNGGVFIKNVDNTFSFSQEPLHIQRFQKLWDSKSVKRSSNQKVCPEDSAIELLKSKGFKILKMEFDSDQAFANPSKPVSTFMKWVEV